MSGDKTAVIDEALPQGGEKNRAVAIACLVVFLFLYALFFETALLFLFVIAVALLFWVMHKDCPSDDSFDSKRQLKRVLRGHHLAEDDPHKPKGFWGQNFARLGASLATELPSAMGQHHVTIQPYLGTSIASWHAQVVCRDWQGHHECQ